MKTGLFRGQCSGIGPVSPPPTDVILGYQSNYKNAKGFNRVKRETFKPNFLILCVYLLELGPGSLVQQLDTATIFYNKGIPVFSGSGHLITQT